MSDEVVGRQLWFQSALNKSRCMTLKAAGAVENSDYT